jgi:NADH-quinone oxidoreductase subunit K
VFSLYVDDLVGQVFALFILTVAAAESSIGLALLVIYYRARGTVAVEFMNLLKG